MAYKKIELYDEEITAALTGNYRHSLDLLGEGACGRGGRCSQLLVQPLCEGAVGLQGGCGLPQKSAPNRISTFCASATICV